MATPFRHYRTALSLQSTRTYRASFDSLCSRTISAKNKEFSFSKKQDSYVCLALYHANVLEVLKQIVGGGIM